MMRAWAAVTLLCLSACGRSEPWRLTGAGLAVIDGGLAERDGGLPAADGGLLLVDGGSECPPGLQPTIAPYFLNGRPDGAFQSGPGTGQSSTIRVSFPCAVSRVAVTVFDPDYPGNALRAEDAAGKRVAEVAFASDGKPGVLTSDRREVAGAGVKVVLLIAAPGDYVWWAELTWE